MFFKGKSRQDVPVLPPSLDHNSFELNEARTEKPPFLLRNDTAGGITPYLGLRARLSQIWFNRWTILILLVLVRVIILAGNLNYELVDAQTKALSACSKVEDIGSAMASMPHYLSVGVNALAADGITAVVRGFVDILQMILTGVEAMIEFILEMYLGTYACLAAAFIHGGLEVGIAAVEDLTTFFNENIGNIVTTIDNDISSFQNDLNSFISGIESAASLFGANNKPPTLDLTSDLNSLKNIQINDTSFVGDLMQLNNTIPTFDQVQTLTENAIDLPFALIRELINGSLATYSFDKSIFPVADKQSLSFCSDNSFLVNFFDDLFSIVAMAKLIFIIVLVVLAVLACIPMTLLEIRRYRKQQRLAKLLTKYGYDAMDVAYIASRPFTATWGIRIASRFKGKRQLLARWAVAYGSSLPAIFVLSLALAGLLSALCQFILYRALLKEAPALAAEVGDFAGEVVQTLEAVSVQWATDANNVILDVQGDINNDLLGWVVNATTAVNNTLNTFDSQIETALEDFFKGSVLENTVLNVFNCLIGRKIEGIEAGLTWVKNEAHVTLPLFPNDTFSLGAAESIGNDTALTSFLSSPSSVTTDDITAAVDYVLGMLKNNIIQETLTACGLLLVFIIVILIGIIRSLSGMAIPARTRGDGGQRFVDPRAALDSDAGSAPLTGDKRGLAVPRSPRRSRSESPPRFPFAGADGGDAVAEAWNASAPGDEKFGGAKRQVGGGKIRREYRGHVRQSSYGEVEDAGR